MARAVERLNALQVAKIKKAGYHCDGAGLYLQVTGAGAKSWIFRFRRGGKLRDMGLGSASTFSLVEARERAKAARQLLADGVDPLEHKRQQRQQRSEAAANRRTFDWCAQQYIESHEAGWKNAKHAGQWRATIATYAAPIIGGMDVATIQTEHIMRVLTPIWTVKAETASRLRGRLESILAWATVQGYRPAGTNPAQWTNHLDQLLPSRRKVQAVEHHAALPWREVGAFMRELRGQQSTAARAVEFVILTACRTSEVFNADWQEIDLTDKRWTIPASRMKAGREHVVPLSDAAVKLLTAQAAEHGATGYVFPGRKPNSSLSNMAGLQLLKRMNRVDLTVHGFRSTFRDWAGEATAHPREVIEHALAHQLRDKAEAAYQRGDLLQKRRVLMADWGQYCDRVALPADVVQLVRSA